MKYFCHKFLLPKTIIPIQEQTIPPGRTIGNMFINPFIEGFYGLLSEEEDKNILIMIISARIMVLCSVHDETKAISSTASRECFCDPCNCDLHKNTTITVFV